MLRLERHALGPRVFLLGRRLHEWHLGLVAITGSLVAVLAGWIGPGTALVASILGAWLVVKDWPDLTQRGRDTAAWGLGLHRRPLPLRPARHLDDVPVVAAIATADALAGAAIATTANAAAKAATASSGTSTSAERNVPGSWRAVNEERLRRSSTAQPAVSAASSMSRPFNRSKTASAESNTTARCSAPDRRR